VTLRSPMGRSPLAPSGGESREVIERPSVVDEPLGAAIASSPLSEAELGVARPAAGVVWGTTGAAAG